MIYFLILTMSFPSMILCSSSKRFFIHFQASTRVYDVAIESPMTFAKNLSAKVGRGNKIHLKREDMQPVCFSFKIRGAYNRFLSTQINSNAQDVCFDARGEKTRCDRCECWKPRSRGCAICQKTRNSCRDCYANDCSRN